MSQLCVDQSIDGLRGVERASVDESERRGASADQDDLFTSPFWTNVVQDRTLILATLKLSPTHLH